MHMGDATSHGTLTGFDIVDIRTNHRMTQQDFAERAGVSKRTIANWEKDEVLSRRAEAIVWAVQQQLDEERGAQQLIDDGVRARVVELERRVDYLEAIVLRERADELAARRDMAGLSVPPRSLRAVADSNRDADAEGEANQEEP